MEDRCIIVYDLNMASIIVFLHQHLQNKITKINSYSARVGARTTNILAVRVLPPGQEPQHTCL